MIIEQHRRVIQYLKVYCSLKTASRCEHPQDRTSDVAGDIARVIDVY